MQLLYSVVFWVGMAFGILIGLTVGTFLIGWSRRFQSLTIAFTPLDIRVRGEAPAPLSTSAAGATLKAPQVPLPISGAPTHTIVRVEPDGDRDIRYSGPSSKSARNAWEQLESPSFPGTHEWWVDDTLKTSRTWGGE